MELLGSALAFFGGLVALVCHILIIVKMFQTGRTGLGIVTIILTCCTGIGLFITLIYGWVKASDWRIQNLMLAYTVGFILSIAGNAMNPAHFERIRQMQREQFGR
jgi:hypothetical protein